MNEHHYAVIVGINRYPGISDLSGPVNDATNFHSWLLDAHGGALSADNALLVEASPTGTVLRDPYEAKPLRWQIDRAFLQTTAKAERDIGDDPDRWDRSRLYLFFAGHGVAPYGSDSALLGAEAARGAFGANVDIRLHLDWLRRCAHFREVVVFADCCRNRVNNATPGAPVADACPATKGEVITLVAYATALGDWAYEEIDDHVPPDERRGYFSTALMEALRGDSGAADPATGDVTAASMAGWLRQRVAALTEKKTPPQRVEVSVPAVPMLFRKAVTRPGRAVRIMFPPGEHRRVALIDHARTIVAVWDPAQGAWPISVPDGVFQVVLEGTEDGSPFAADGLFRVRGEGRDVQL